jgi:dolichol-phosphate mannosyltransferase
LKKVGDPQSGSRPDATVIIPTLNEEENIDLLMERLLAVRAVCPRPFRILFVDSFSGDATCEKIRAWMGHDDVALLALEHNIGLASAVIAGARQATTELVLVMDADLSHPPETIPELLGPLTTGSHDIVLGSRYVKGSRIPGWNPRRKFASRLATLPALLFAKARDPLSGFFAVSRHRLTDLPRDVPGFKIALAVLAEDRTLRVKEIPFTFADRNDGQSKMGAKVVVDYLYQLAGLFYRRLTERS